MGSGRSTTKEKQEQEPQRKRASSKAALNKIVALRNELGLTGADTAKELGYSHSMYSRWMKNGKAPDTVGMAAEQMLTKIRRRREGAEAVEPDDQISVLVIKAQGADQRDHLIKYLDAMQVAYNEVE